MNGISIRIAGRAGRITLDRPEAMNAVTHDMVLAIDAALIAWADDPAVAVVVIDAAGERAFCAGGDIARMYETGRAGDYAYGRAFWRDEYRMNARISRFPKPVVSFMQGFTMGGGVGVGCHASHRVVGATSKVAMPECGIGLIPDVGGSLLLARAPGRLGEYLGVTAARMDGADAIHAGFADSLVPEADWCDLIAALERTGDPADLATAAEAPGPSALAARSPEIDRLFAAPDLASLRSALAAADTEFAGTALAALERVSPLSADCTLALLPEVRARDTIEAALEMECRFTARSMEHGDFLEGIRAAIIEKDRRPVWRNHDAEAVAAMLRPLGTEHEYREGTS